jgi:hypothetical protein
MILRKFHDAPPVVLEYKAIATLARSPSLVGTQSGLAAFCSR